jgi:hypothetical protein
VKHEFPWCVLLVLAGACAGRPPSENGSAGDAVEGTPDASVTLPPLYARDLAITRVVVFQAVAVPVWTNGAPVPAATRNAPLVAGREAAVRIHVAAQQGWTPVSVTAHAEVVHGQGLVESATDTRVPEPPSSDDNPASLFTVMLPATAWQEDSTLRVWLTSEGGSEVAAGTAHPAHVPLVEDRLVLGVRPTWPVRIHLVPVMYLADISQRLPDTSPEQLQRMREAFAAFYPLAETILTVGEPLRWSRALNLLGNVNFNALNDALYDRRVADAPAPDVYYYGLISPADTLDLYCGGSCVTGQSYAVDDPADATIRLGAGMGFGTYDSVLTMVHEVGHMFGRYHSPCDVSDADPGFPYPNGGIGVWGFDRRDQHFISPNLGTDFMGYCDGYWVSDHTFGALHQRMEALAALQKPRHAAPATWRTLHLDPDGSSLWGPTRFASRPHGSGITTLRCTSAAGAETGVVDAVIINTSQQGASLWMPLLPPGTQRVTGMVGRIPVNITLAP